MDSLWNSLNVVNTIRIIAQWIVALSAIIVLVFSMRASALKDKYDSIKAKQDLEEKTRFKDAIDSAHTEAESLKTQLADASKRITHAEMVIKPKPLKNRILDYLQKLDVHIIPNAKNGQREFFGNFTFSQIAELQSLCAEDKTHAFIQLLKSNSMIMNQPGTQAGIGFAIMDELLK